MSDWKSRATKVEDWKLRATAIEAEDAPIEDERTPYVGIIDRTIAKNLAQSVNKQAEYIKSQYPDLEVMVQGGNVAIRKPGDESFKVLDPSGFELEDVTDLGDTALGAVASTVGAGLGAAGGSLAAGIGAVPGGIAGAATAGAGFEALRQRLGKALGIPQDVDMGDVATAGALNAAGVGLFGQPATQAGKGIVSSLKGVSDDVAAQMVNAPGLIETAYKKGAPALTNMWFGTSDDVLKKYVDPTTREAVDQLASGGKTQYVEDLVSKIRGALNTEKRSVGEALAAEIDDAGSISLRKAKEALDGAVRKAQMDFEAVPNAINKAKLDDAVATYTQLFENTAGKAVPDEMKASQAWRMQDDLRDFADLRRTSSGVNSRFASSATQAEKDLSNAALESYNAIGKELSKATEGASGGLKKQYADLMDIQNAISPYLKTDQSAYTTFKNSDSSAKVMFKEALDKLAEKSGQNFSDDITTLQAADYFGSGSWMPKSIGGTTSTSRTIPATAIGAFLGAKFGAAALGPAGALLGGTIGMAGGNALASPMMLKNAIKATDPVRATVNNISPYLRPTVVPIREAVKYSTWQDVD